MRDLDNPIAGTASDCEDLPNGDFYFLLKPNRIPYQVFYITKKSGADGLNKKVQNACKSKEQIAVFYDIVTLDDGTKRRYVTDVR